MLFLAAPVGLLGALHPPGTGSNMSRPNTRPFLTAAGTRPFPEGPRSHCEAIPSSEALPVACQAQTSFRFRPRRASNCWHLFLCSPVSSCPSVSSSQKIAHLLSSHLCGRLPIHRPCQAEVRMDDEVAVPKRECKGVPVCALLSSVSGVEPGSYKNKPLLMN